MTDVRILGHRIPPFSLHNKQGEVEGFSADLFQHVSQKISGSKEKTPIRAVTFNRLYTELQHGERRIGITVGRNAKREKLFQWVGPYLSINLGVIARKERKFIINDVKDFSGHKIATIENTAPEQALFKLGLSADNLNRDIFPERSIKKLAHNRVDFMAYPLQAASYIMTQNGIVPGDFEEVFPLKKIDLYFAFSRDFSQDEIKVWQSHLDEVLNSDFYIRLKDKYTLDGIAKYIPRQ